MDCNVGGKKGVEMMKYYSQSQIFFLLDSSREDVAIEYIVKSNFMPFLFHSLSYDRYRYRYS